MPVTEFHFDRGMMETYKGSDSCLDLYQQHHHYYSAPSSPNAFTASSDAGSRNWQSSTPFEWEEKPGTRNSYNGGVDVNNSDDFDFAFAFDSISKRREKVSYPPLAAADELFEKGVIRPLKTPPRLSSPVKGDQSPKSPRNRVFFSPLRRGRGRTGKELDPFAVAMKETTGERVKDRNRNYTRSAAHSMSYSRSRKGSRSLSPFRGRGGSRGDHRTFESSSPPSLTGKRGSGGWKWRLKGFLLFRRGDGSKDSLSKHGSFSSSSSSSLSSSSSSSSSSSFMSKVLMKGSSSVGEDSRNSSFRSVHSGPMRRGEEVTPHEKHYTENRAAAAELKKKTALPYKQTIFGFLRFSPAVRSLGGGGPVGLSSINHE